MTHIFENSLEIGKKAEGLFDEYFRGRGYKVDDVDLETEKSYGIDRVVTTPDGEIVTLEYKSDFRSGATGNVFVETVSQHYHGKDAPTKLGWAVTCQADWLLYAVWGENPIVVIKPETIRGNIGYWSQNYRTVRANNSSYFGLGILVPVHEFRRVASGKIHIPEENWNIYNES